MPVNIDQELDRIPNIDRYPALSAARGTAILYPVEPTIKDEAEMVKLSLYTNHKSTTHERTAALELSVKLGCPTFQMPDDPPPWMGQFQATLTGIQTQLGAVQAQVTGVENQLGGIRTDLVAFRNQTTQSLLRLEHAQKQAATRAQNHALAVSGFDMQSVAADYDDNGHLKILPTTFNGANLESIKACDERVLNRAMDAYSLVLPGGHRVADKEKKVRLVYIYLGGVDIAPQSYQ